jgi:hypothetical protein
MIWLRNISRSTTQVWSISISSWNEIVRWLAGSEASQERGSGPWSSVTSAAGRCAIRPSVRGAADADLARELVAQIDIAIGPEGLEQTWLEIYGGDEPPHHTAPVHPSVLRHFGIEWAGTPARFRWHYDGLLTVGEIAKRAVLLKSDEASKLFHRADESGEGACGNLPLIYHSTTIRYTSGYARDRCYGKPNAAATLPSSTPRRRIACQIIPRRNAPRSCCTSHPM